MPLLSEADRRRIDDRPDEVFYDQPRFVTHADDAFLDRLTALYAEVLEPGDRVLDAMSSWVSHLPDLPFECVCGHGLNAAELAANPRLDEYFCRDLNAEPGLPLPDGDRDAVLCALSVQYLQYPGQVFAEFGRVLAPGGVLVVSFTGRLFPTKAIRAWREADMAGRLALVEAYVESTESLAVVRTLAERPGADPFYAVVARHPRGETGTTFPGPTRRPGMQAVRNENSGTWHLVGARGCGAEPAGDVVEGTWAEIRDRVDRDAGSRCGNCRWPRG